MSDYETLCKLSPATRERHPTEASFLASLEWERQRATRDEREKRVCNAVGTVAACFLWPVFLIP
ncbi:MAG: hypothetical protein LBV54_03040 [Puniceicoccales bacterium]|nr:hypothetical protein [Puniceicoccales bacterium]